ncbi:MAG: hypothetical protein ACLP50_19090 [Solirubrobacteraceae bacterium]
MQITRATARHRALSNTHPARRTRRAIRWCRLALTALVSLLGTALLGTALLAGTALAAPSPQGPSYSFRTLNNNSDPTFNQLLGINNRGVIAGYFGSGAQGHPNKGYLLTHFGSLKFYGSENFPGSVQTQVTGLNDHGVSVGFWSDQNNANLSNDNFGFYSINGRRFHTVNFPTTDNSTPPVNQLLGVNDFDVAVGFYTDGAGASHGYTYNIFTNHYQLLSIPGAQDVTAAAINNRNEIAGFETDANGNVDGFLLNGHGTTVLDYPQATTTEALGVNDFDEVVGVYQDSDSTMHGFTWTPAGGYQTVDDPDGVGTTTINGVNDWGQLVGFYTDANTNVDGLLATPRF